MVLGGMLMVRGEVSVSGVCLQRLFEDLAGEGARLLRIGEWVVARDGSKVGNVPYTASLRS
jgi:hypothetical protein